MRKAGVGMFLVFFLLGFSSIIIQTTLIREFLVVFEGNELCLGGIFGIWFLWIMIGAPVGSLLSKWVRNVGAIFAVSVLIGALAPFVQIYAIRIVRDIFDVPMSLYVSFPEMLLFALICVAPFTFMVGVTFPLGVKVYSQLRDLHETKGIYVPPPPEPTAGADKAAPDEEAKVSLPGEEISSGLDAAFGVEEPSADKEGEKPAGQEEGSPPADKPANDAPAPPPPDPASATDATKDPAGIGWIYVLESFGFLAGGVFFTFVLVEHYMPFLNAAVVFGVLSLLCFLLDLNCFSRGVRVAFGIVFLAIAGERIFSAAAMDDYTALRRWKALKLDLNFVDSIDSRYENLAIGQSKTVSESYSVFGNGAIMFSFPEPYDLPQVANIVLYEHPNPKKVLLIGNGSHGLIRYMLMHPLDRLVHVELDPKMTDLIQPYLPEEDQEVLSGVRINRLSPGVREQLKPVLVETYEKTLAQTRLNDLPLSIEESIRPQLPTEGRDTVWCKRLCELDAKTMEAVRAGLTNYCLTAMGNKRLGDLDAATREKIKPILAEHYQKTLGEKKFAGISPTAMAVIRPILAEAYLSASGAKPLKELTPDVAAMIDPALREECLNALKGKTLGELDAASKEAIKPHLPKENQEACWSKRLADLPFPARGMVEMALGNAYVKALGERPLNALDAPTLKRVKPYMAEAFLAEFADQPLSKLNPDLLNRIKPLLGKEYLRAFGDPRLDKVYGDGRYYVKTAKERFDVVFANVPDPSSAMINRYYTEDFYEEVKRILDPGGVYAGTMSSAVNYMGEDIADYAGSLFHTLRDAFETPGGEVVITPGEHNYVFASLNKGVVSINGGDDGLLVRRFLERGVKFQNFTKDLFILIVANDLKQKWLRDRLMEHKNVPRNTDMRPISYFYQLLIWDQKTEHPTITFRGKPYPIKVAPTFRWIHNFDLNGFSIVKTNNAKLQKVIDALTWIRTKLHIHDLIVVVLALLLLRLLYSLLIRRSIPPQARFNALLSMAACGFGSMVFSITLLFAFQNLYGYLYHMIGLITALFMFGLAVGGLVITILLKRMRTGYTVLLVLLLVLLVYAILLPPGIEALASGFLSRLSIRASQVCYMVILAVGGSLTGLTFPLASRIYFEHSRHTGVTAGLVHGADHGGACLGSFLSGTIFVPILGLAKSCYLVAVIAGACLVLQGLLVLKERRTSCRDS